MGSYQAFCMFATVVELGLFVRLLAMRSGPVPGDQLAFGNLFPILDYLDQLSYRRRSPNLPQIDGPFYVQGHKKTDLSEWRQRRSGSVEMVQTGDGEGIGMRVRREDCGWHVKQRKYINTKKPQMAKIQLKSCSTSLAIRVMQCKTTLRYNQKS